MIQEFEVKNCQKYTNDFLCEFCEQNYYLHNARCYKIKNIIDNCIYYSNQQLCTQCNKGYYNDYKTCIKNDILNNCSYSGKLKCLKCKENYGLNENFFLQNFLDEQDQNFFLNILDFNHQQFLKILQDEVMFQTNEICQPIKFDNCKYYTYYNQCEQCLEGYYKQNGQCHQFPENRILNCMEYTSKDQCSQCLDGYFLNYDYDCEKNQNILHCKIYSSFQHTKTRCLECKENHYLFDNRCIQRINQIDFCMKYTINEDNCDQCLQGFQITNNGEKCIKQILNCKEYEFNNDYLKCVQCQDQYYLKDEQCQKGTIKDCLIYYINEDICQKCEQNFLLKNNLCIKIQEIKNCLYYNAEKGQCIKCKQQHILLKQQKQCDIVNLIVACKKYLSKNICQECEIGYYLTHDYQCKKIQKELNCLILDQNKNCIQCQTNYLLHNQKCKLIPNIQNLGCEQSNQKQIKFMSDLSCKICRSNYIPIFYTQLFYCEIEDNQKKLIIENCKRYQINKDQTSCLQCIQDYVLFNNKCILESQCQDTIQILNFNNENKYIDRINICTKFQEGCQYSSIIQENKQQQNCYKCNKDYIQILDIQSQKYVKLINSKQQQNNLDQPIVQCLKKDLIQQPILNCQYYQKINDQYYCQRCELGFVGTIEKQDNFIFIKNCIRYFECSLLPQNSLNKKLSKFLSCQACINKDNIIYLKVDFDEDTDEITQYSYDQNDNNMNIECKKYQHSLPLYCSIAAISFINNKQKLNCINCKPGFRPIKQTTISDKVLQCEQIQNCEKSIWNNKCSNCKKGYAWEYSQNIIHYDKCIKSNNNCLIQDIEQTIGCKTCHKGYYLYKGNCFKIQLDLCDNLNIISQFEFQNIELLIYKNSFFSGCQQCQNNSLNLLLENFKQKHMCLLNINQNQLIQYCTNYLVENNQIKCDTCSQKRIPNINQQQCLNISSNNCKIINEYTNTCHQCKKDWVVDNGLCSMPQIQACLKYKNNFNQGKQQCKQCIEGYYLNNYQCEKIEIKNCLQINQQRNCILCQDNYILAQTQQQNLCIPKISNSKCLILTSINQKQFSCIQCEFDYYLKDYNQNICLPINNIENCQDYNLENDYIKCIKCEQDYQLIENQCIYLNENQKRCQIFYQNSDKCKQCKSGFYLSQQYNCVPNPSGIPHCEIYTQNDSCQRCQTGFYLNKNQCIKSTVTLKNCKYQKNNQQCLKCQDEYINLNGICQQTDIKYCKVFQDKNNCQECIEDYFLFNHFNNMICKQIQKDEKCLRVQNQYPYYCIKCQQNYYPSENKCIKVMKFKDNCLYYDKDQNCMICSQQYYLSSNKQCLSYMNKLYEFDNNCQITKETSPFCIICDLGYFIQSGECIKCPVKNCAICQPYQPSLCLICKPNYYIILINKKFSSCRIIY